MKNIVAFSAIFLFVAHVASGEEVKVSGQNGFAIGSYNVATAAATESRDSCEERVNSAIPGRYVLAIKAAVAECIKPTWSWSD